MNSKNRFGVLFAPVSLMGNNKSAKTSILQGFQAMSLEFA